MYLDTFFFEKNQKKSDLQLSQMFYDQEIPLVSYTCVSDMIWTYDSWKPL